MQNDGRVRSDQTEEPSEPPQVVVVTPVLNLSDSTDWDPVRVTDVLASEFQSFPEFVVVPVNRTLAALELLGKAAVETPADARELAGELDADLVVVMAITEYEPFDPPRVGVLVQCYARERRGGTSGLDPVLASRQAAAVAPAGTAEAGAGPLLQVQAVYDAAKQETLEDLERYGRSRSGHQSPHAWRIHAKVQELFVRYSCWASIRSIRDSLEGYRIMSARGAARP